MNGSKIKVVIDTNIIFMSLYKKDSKSSFLIKAASKDKILLFAPDTVKEEIQRVLKMEFGYDNQKINITLEGLPITWIGKEIYEPFIAITKVQHKADKPIEALSLALGCKILSADKHFNDRTSVNELLKEISG